MSHLHPIRHLPAGVMLSNRIHTPVSFSWLKLLFLIAAALAVIAILGLVKVAASADFRADVPDQAIGVTQQTDRKIIAVGATVRNQESDWKRRSS